MYTLRTSLALIASGVVHLGIIVVLASRSTATYLPVNTFAPMEVVAPPPPSTPTPPEPPKADEPPPPEPPPKPLTETHVRSLQPTPPTNPTPTPVQEPLSPQTPVALAGVSLSNEGVALPQGNGSGFGKSTAHKVNTTAPSATQPAPAPLQLTSLSDLSRKPSPPALNAALARHYPVHLRSSGVEGQALVRVIVGRAGEVRTTTLLSETHNGFGNACQKALEKSRWGPPIDQSGNPTSTSLQYRCRFTVGL